MSSDIRSLAMACRDAAPLVAMLDTDAKRALLRDMAASIEHRTAEVLEANARDMRAASAGACVTTTSATFSSRLICTRRSARLDALA